MNARQIVAHTPAAALLIPNLSTAWRDDSLAKVQAGLAGTEQSNPANVPMQIASSLLWLAGSAAAIALTYHGYKRNNGSVGWALVWGLFGGMVWPFTAPIAYAQGFGKPKKKEI
jgi:hypothetical protein